MSLPYFKADTDGYLEAMSAMEWKTTPPRALMHTEVKAVVAGDQLSQWSKIRWARRWRVHHTTVARRLAEVLEWMDEYGEEEWWEAPPGRRHSRRHVFVHKYPFTIPHVGGSGLGPVAAIRPPTGPSVYFARDGDLVKIGHFTSDCWSRLKQLQTGNPRRLHLVAAIACTTAAEAVALEMELHQSFREHHVRGEWFALSPAQVATVVAATTDGGAP